MSEMQRETAAKYIKKNAREWYIGWADENEIDTLNVTGASMKAFHNCLNQFKIQFKKIIMDGTYFLPYSRDGEIVDYSCVPRADSRCLAVSCASILAKHSRDKFITKLCKIYPELNTRYDIESNLGYPLPNHKLGINKYGITQFHRKTYKPCINMRYNPICTILIDD